MSETALPPRTHNNPPVTPPTPEALSDDLKSRFPELESRLDEFVKAFATYPKKLSLKDEDVAASLAAAAVPDLLLGVYRKAVFAPALRTRPDTLRADPAQLNAAPLDHHLDRQRFAKLLQK